MRIFHQLQLCILLNATLIPMTTFAANSVATPQISVNVQVDDAVEMYPDPLTNTTITFDPITLSNYETPDAKVVANEFSFYVNDFTHDIQIALTTPAGQSNNINTWMNIEGGGSEKIDYGIEYTTCYNGSDRQIINLSTNSGSNCADHVCTIPNQYANNLTCFPGGGGGGKLRVIRYGVDNMPAAGDYTGQFTLTASLV